MGGIELELANMFAPGAMENGSEMGIMLNALADVRKLPQLLLDIARNKY